MLLAHPTPYIGIVTQDGECDSGQKGSADHNKSVVSCLAVGACQKQINDSGREQNRDIWKNRAKDRLKQGKRNQVAIEPSGYF